MDSSKLDVIIELCDWSDFQLNHLALEKRKEILPLIFLGSRNTVSGGRYLDF
jgi:hypothetical protein